MSDLKQLVVIDTSGANISSIKNSLFRIGYEAKLTTEKKTIESAHHILLPGVGSAKYAMEYLKEKETFQQIAPFFLKLPKQQ